MVRVLDFPPPIPYNDVTHRDFNNFIRTRNTRPYS